MEELKTKKNLLLDLDGTVYQDLEAVFGQVSRLMTKYISEKLHIDLTKAKELQTNYFYKYNTSLNGLMIHHDIPPKEFLNYVLKCEQNFIFNYLFFLIIFYNIVISCIFIIRIWTT